MQSRRPLPTPGPSFAPPCPGKAEGVPLGYTKVWGLHVVLGPWGPWQPPAQLRADLFSCNEKQRAGERAWNALGRVSGSFFPLRSLLDACHSAERLPHSVTHSPPLPTPNTRGAAAAASSLQVLPSEQAWQWGLS